MIVETVEKTKPDVDFSAKMSRDGKVFDLAHNYSWMVKFTRPENNQGWSDASDARLVMYRQGILDCQEIIQKSGFAAREGSDAAGALPIYSGGIVDLTAGCEQASLDIKNYLLKNCAGDDSRSEHMEYVLKSSYRLSIKDAHEAIFKIFCDSDVMKNIVGKAPDDF